LFNVLSGGCPEALAGTLWFDLFAGTGAVGLEALSRGAGHVSFVESAPPNAAVIRENLRSLGITGGYALIERNALPALRQLDSAAVVCDVCFLDPPYHDTGAYYDVLSFLSQSRLLRPASVVVAEHDKRFDPGSHFGLLERYRTLNQGDSGLSFYRRV
jgi:16S rRNA (guanine966-N2)-methyltransferase